MRGSPGFLVAAAFIGPGTVTTCTLAGAAFGTDLLWVLAFATAATVLLQEMSGRLGLATGAGLVENLAGLAPPWGRAVAWLTGLAVLLGVIAFEAGNLSGAGLGLEAVTGTGSRAWTAAMTVLAGALLYLGRYRLLERVLVGCVAAMAVVFLITAGMVASSWDDVAIGLLRPAVPERAGLTVLALVGTTIVPYNLFLYAAAVRERGRGIGDLPGMRRDLVLAVGLGGLISAAIVVTAASVIGGAGIESAVDMARQLEPLLGDWARVAFGAGFALAGISSAITAPLAAAWIVSGLMGGAGLQTPLARGTAVACVLVGAALALTGIRPVRLILVAQAANGLILPVVALALLLALNDRRRMGDHANGWPGNLAGIVVVALCALLAIRIGWG